MEEEIIVSISCITYNHEKYIADAVESFLMQKTNFKYEILIHDDASMDKTADIIKDYEKKYPNLIKPIYQTENQYSKGVKVGKFNRNRAKGRYIALCEGDDYWIDPHKLQKQVDYMEMHPDCCICAHATYRVDTMKRKMKKHVRPSIGNKIFTAKEVIEGGGGFFHTSSIMYPTRIDFYKISFYENAPVGDHPMVIYLALKGTSYYIDEFMSAHRIGVFGSWKSKMTIYNIEAFSIEKRIDIIKKRIEMLDEINIYTKYKYNNAITKEKNEYILSIMIQQGKYKDIRKGGYKDIYRELGFLTKAKLYIKEYFPGFITTYKSIQRKYRS